MDDRGSRDRAARLAVRWVEDRLTLENLGDRPARRVRVRVATPDEDLTYVTVVPLLPAGGARPIPLALEMGELPALCVRLRWREGLLRRRVLEGTVRRLRPLPDPGDRSSPVTR